MKTKELFDLSGKTAIITGGAGLLGEKHAEAIAEFGGIPILLDLNGDLAKEKALRIAVEYGTPCISFRCDITRKKELEKVRDRIIRDWGKIDILINNAAIDPKVDNRRSKEALGRLESFGLERWNDELAVGLTGAFLCSQVFGTTMAKRESGVILNISSDLGIVAPDQRLYRKSGVPDELQPAKPVTYSVIKHGLIGLTKYLSTYWNDRGVRVNTLCPGGVRANQDVVFLSRISSLIPLGRMAQRDEYKAAVVFLTCNASSYMTGATMVMDGGRSIW